MESVEPPSLEIAPNWTWSWTTCSRWGRDGGFHSSSSSLPITQEANLEKVHLALKANRSPSELDALCAQLLDDTIADCRYVLPGFSVSLGMAFTALGYLGRDKVFLHLRKLRVIGQCWLQKLLSQGMELER